MSLLLVEDSPQGIRTVTLNRVDKLNALSRELIDELTRVAEESARLAADYKLRAWLLRSGTPKAFCVGADLSERLKMNAEQVAETLLVQRKLMDGVAAIPVPTFAVLEGAAFGGGLELALACDFRFCSAAASLGLTETRLAIIPGAGGTQRLTRLVGEAKAKELVFFARRLSGAEALAAGIVNACVDAPLEQAKNWAEELLPAGPVAIVAAKKAIEGGLHLDLPKALDFERACYETVLHTEDRAEGLKAFSEKRPPIYKGR